MARGRAGRLRRAFVSGQVGMSMLLLAAAALFLRSVQAASDIDPGFDAAGAYLTTLKLELEGYREPERGRELLRTLLERLRRVPVIDAAAAANDLPLDFSEHGTGAIPEGWDFRDEGDYLGVDYAIVSPGYFETLGIRLIRGREFQFGDRADAPPVAIVSRSFIERAWPGADPLGRRFRFGSPAGPMLTVVGVVDDVKNQVITEAVDPFVYLPITQEYTGSVSIVVRATAGAGAAVPEILRREILAVDRALSVTPVMSLVRYTALGTLPQRLAALIASALGALALLLSALGVYGVVAYAVAQRTREIGIRMALGADRRSLIRLILKGGLALALPGLIVAAPLTILMAVALRGFILGVSPLDPLALGSVVAVLFATTVLASLAPARRASRVEPLQALRHE